MLVSLGSLLLKQEKWADAELVLRECLAIRQQAQPDEWTTFNTQSLLGGALLGQKKYTEAEPLLVQGYDGMRARESAIPLAGGSKLYLAKALDRLIELCMATDKRDDVQKWQAERAKYPKAEEPDASK